MTQDNTPPSTARPRRTANRQANSPVPVRPAVQPPVPLAVQAKNVTTAVAPGKVGMAEIKILLHSKIEAIRRVIPQGVQLSAEGLIQNALLQMETARDRNIKCCTPVSVLYSVMAAAQAGLDFIGEQAYLIPMSKKVNQGGQLVHSHYYCTLWPGYRGLCTIASRFGYFMDVQDVRANDEITIDLGANRVNHNVRLGQRGDLVGVYCNVRRISDGLVLHIEPMDKAEIDALRQDTEPWAKHYNAMGKKSVAKRGFKWIPKDRADARIIEEVERRNETNQELDGLTEPAPDNGENTVI